MLSLQELKVQRMDNIVDEVGPQSYFPEHHLLSAVFCPSLCMVAVI